MLLPPPNEEKRDSVPPTTYKNILKYIKSKDIRYEKVNETEWGSYQLSFSLHGIQFMVIPRYFGWGYSPPEALSTILAEWIDQNNTPEIVVNFLGTDMFSEIKSLKV